LISQSKHVSYVLYIGHNFSGLKELSQIDRLQFFFPITVAHRSYDRTDVSSIVYDTHGEVHVHGKNNLKRITIEAVDTGSLILPDELDIRRSKTYNMTANMIHRMVAVKMQTNIIFHLLSLVHSYADFARKAEH